jgi:YfiH family protein
MDMPKPLLAPGLSSLTGIAHGFFTRHGGVSAGIYASLNCGIGSKDEPAAIRKNRGRVTSHLGAGDLASAYQVHGTTALVVSEPWPAGERPKADAMVTATPGIALGVLTADCAPVLFADEQARVVAAVHAGWRGALSGVVEAAIEAMESLGAKRERIRAAVGPCIGQGAYEVGPEFKAEFLDRDSASARFFTSPNMNGRPHFDLSGYVGHRLRRAKVANAVALDVCTYARNEDFFSYRRTLSRREPDYGRQISAIVLT